MTTVEVTPAYPSYAHPLVSWGAVILGAVAAIAIGVLLNLLVAVFDGAATLHQLAHTGEAGDNALLIGVFGAVANFVALFTGGFVAARSANHPDHHDGMLHGLGVWALSFVVAFVIMGAGVSKAVDSAMHEETGGGGSAAMMQAPAALSAAASPPAADQQRAAEVDAQTEGREMAKAATQTAFWGFAAMLIGLGSALFGGVLGSRHPEHFTVRPRRTGVIG